MLPSTYELIRAALKTDPSLSIADRTAILTLLRAGKPHTPKSDRFQPPARVLRRQEAAKLLGCSPRSLDRWSQAGFLPKFRLPGRSRAAGYRHRDVVALINRENDEVRHE